MAQLAPVVISDGKATPIVHTFGPTSASNGTDARFHERLAAGIALAFPQMDLLVRPASGFDGVNKVTLMLKMPQMEVLSGSDAGYTPAPKVAYFDMVKTEFYLPGRSTSANRKDVRALLINALANAIVIDAIENLAPAY